MASPFEHERSSSLPTQNVAVASLCGHELRDLLMCEIGYQSLGSCWEL